MKGRYVEGWMAFSQYI